MDFDSSDRPVKTDKSATKSSSSRKSAFRGARKCCGIAVAASVTFWLIILLLALASAIPIAQLIVGSLHKNECPMNPMIPKYLIVAGAAGITLIVLSYAQNLLGETGVYCLFLTIPLALFNFAWFIAGSVWVFKAKSTVQFYNPQSINTYCHGSVFNCAFVTLIITYVFICLTCMGCSSSRNAK